MTRGRQLSIDLHSAIELMIGAVLIGVPFVIGLPTAAVAFSIPVGALILGLALTASEPGARGSVPLSAHAAYDRGFGIGLVAAGIAFGLVDGLGSLVFFLIAGALELLLAPHNPLHPEPHLRPLPTITYASLLPRTARFPGRVVLSCVLEQKPEHAGRGHH